MSADTRYRLAPGAQVLRRPDDRLLVKTEFTSIELKGPSAQLFEASILPALDGETTVESIARSAGFSDGTALGALLDEMNEAGVLLRADPAGEPLLDYLEMIGLDRGQSDERLRALKVAVVGTTGPGRAIADLLSQLPLGRVSLVPQAVPPTSAAADAFTLDALRQVAADHDFVISTLGGGFAAVDHRVNRIIHETGTAAIFCNAGVAKCVVGPMVFPFETACFTCWRMRTAACASSFPDHMDYEDRLAAMDRPTEHVPSALGHLSAMVAGSVVNELLKAALALGRPLITDRVLELEPFRGGWSEHSVLRRPDCPVCSKKNATERVERQVPGLASAYDRLISPSTGIVRKLERVHKGLSDPAKPFIYRAEIANHRFLDDASEAFVVASGKGFTDAAARLSAMGEAVERYSAAGWGEDRIVRGTARSLDMEVLDPHRVVLFDASQYPVLNYDPYTPDATIGWVAMRSCTDDRERAVPALAVLMAYETGANEPFLFPITSNGLAAGPDLPAAILSAACEGIERDAFLITWLNRLPAARIATTDHPDAETRMLVEAHARRGVALELYRLATDAGVHVFMGIAVDERADGGPAAVVGLGASHDPAPAATSALIECCQVRPALGARLRSPEGRETLAALLAEPQAVTTLEDHDLLYAHPAMLGQFDFLRGAPATSMDWSSPGDREPAALISTLAARLQELGSDLLYADLTLDDVRSVGAHVVRVVIPDFQPMHFGYRERRLGGTRLFAQPQRLGLADAPSTIASLNPFPHPLA